MSSPAVCSGDRAAPAVGPGAGVLHAISVDVEDYFHVQAFRAGAGTENWDRYPLRAGTSTRRLLDILDEFSVKATFFILGWLGRKLPGLVAEIASRGHEIGCHSHWHRLVYGLTAREFREDTAEATRSIEDASGCAVGGYRAPCYSVVPRSLWALEVLADLGYEYDSSIFPIRHDIYGFRRFPRFPVRVVLPGGREIVEFPMSTLRLLGMNLPGPGGGYLRILPRAYSRLALRRLAREGRPGLVYLHPWELDPGQPRLAGKLRSRFRHYTSLERTEGKLRALLGEFRFAPLGEVLRRMPPREVFDAAHSGRAVAEPRR